MAIHGALERRRNRRRSPRPAPSSPAVVGTRGRSLEVTSTLPDGTVVDGIEGVRRLVLRDPALFVEAMTGKLLMYALTRNIQHYDQPTIRVIARESAGQNYTFASLVQGVVNSVPFQSRMAQSLPERLGDVP